MPDCRRHCTHVWKESTGSDPVIVGRLEGTAQGAKLN